MILELSRNYYIKITEPTMKTLSGIINIHTDDFSLTALCLSDWIEFVHKVLDCHHQIAGFIIRNQVVSAKHIK